MSPSPFHGIFSALNGGAPIAREGTAPFSPIAAGAGGAPPPTSGRVAVDIYEQDGYYVVKAPIAGVRLSDIDIEVADNVLTIRGRRREAERVVEGQYYLQECFFGEFTRSITFPCTLDPKRVRATLNRENVLKVLVPKEERVKIVRISE